MLLADHGSIGRIIPQSLITFLRVRSGDAARALTHLRRHHGFGRWHLFKHTPSMDSRPPKADSGSECVDVPTSQTEAKVATIDEYVGLDWKRPVLKGYTWSKSSALKTSWIWDFGWRIDDKGGKEFWLCRERIAGKTIATTSTVLVTRLPAVQRTSRTCMAGSGRGSSLASGMIRLLDSE